MRGNPKPIRGVLQLLHNLGGLYICPKDQNGRRLGPLVGYAGKDENGRQKVGDIYANFAYAEQFPYITDYWASSLRLKQVAVCLGMPMGGILFAQSIARAFKLKVIFAEKKVTSAATGSEREVSKLVLNRHEIRPGERVAIVEDVVNSMSTTKEAVRLVTTLGAKAVCVACILNRSNDAETPQGLPIRSVIHRPFPQYEQDDPEVAEDIAKGNLVLKPKYEWSKLMAAMKKHEGG